MTMFEIFGLDKRVRALEEMNARRMSKERCAKGNHAWVMRTSSFSDNPPYIACSNCGERLDNLKKKE